MLRKLLPFFVATFFAASLTGQTLGPERVVSEFSNGPEGWPSSIYSVTPDGDGYVVFWAKDSREPLREADVMVSRVSASGVASPAITLSQNIRVWTLSASRTLGGNFMLAYATSSGTRVVFLNNSFVAITAAQRVAEPSWEVETDCNTRSCALAFRDNNGALQFQLFSAIGESLTDPIKLENQVTSVGLAASRDTFLVLSRPEPYRETVNAAIINTDGTVRSRSERNAVLCEASGIERSYVVACASDYSHLVVSSIDENGVETPSTLIATAPENDGIGSISVASSVSSHLITYALVEPAILITGLVPPQTIHSITLGNNLREISEAPVGVKPAVNWTGDSASNGRDFLVAWNHSESNFGGKGSAFVTAMAANGAVIHEEPLHTGPLDQYTQGIARNASTSLVLWSEPDALYAARLNSDEMPLDRIKLPLTPGFRAYVAAAASDGGDYLTVWNEIGDQPYVVATRVNGFDGRITKGVRIPGWGSRSLIWTGSSYATLLWRNGLKLLRLGLDGGHGGEFDITPAQMNPVNTAMAAARGRILVTWTESAGGIYFAILDSDGSMLVPRTLLEGRSATALFAASNGNEFLVAAGVGPTHAIRIAIDGTFLDSDLVDERASTQPTGVAGLRNGWVVSTAVNGERKARMTFLGSTGDILDRLTVDTDTTFLHGFAAPNDGLGPLSLLFTRITEENVRQAVVREMSVSVPQRRRAVR